MAKYYADLVLKIDEFDADSEEEANAMIDKYVDLLANVVDGTLTWCECDWKLSTTPDP